MSPALSWFVFLLVAALVMALALVLAKTATKEERMSERWVQSFRLTNGGVGIIKFPPETTPEQLKEFRDRWKAAHPPLPLYDQDEQR